MRRREFIKISGALGSALLLGCSKLPTDGPMRGDPDARITVTPTVCNICFWGCAGFVHTLDGQPWKVIGNETDLHSGGRLCTRGTGGIGAYLDRDRLRQPLLRIKGSGGQSFKPVSWDEALGYIAERMQKIAREHGPDRVALFSHGDGGSYFRHLLRAFGSESFAAPSFAQCRGPREVAFQLTFGEGVGSPERTDMDNARCIALIGSHIGENLHNGQVQSFTRAIDNGATIITADPRLSVAAGKSKYWLPIKPGTDIALLLAWMHVLVSEGLYDKDYVARYCHGFDELSRHVRDYTPEWAYTETGLEPALIRATAREMGNSSPAALVHPGRHVTWYGDDTQRERAIAILNALLGSWGRKGGLYIPEKVALPDYPLPPYPRPKSTWKDAQGSKYPLASQGVTHALLERSVGPDAHYRGWIVYATNLALAAPGTADKLHHAAESLDLLVVVDVLPSEITGYADVVLPECTYLERYDELRNSPERMPSLALRMPAFEPRYDSKPAWWMAKQLAQRLDLGRYFPWNDQTELLAWQLQQVGSSLAEMQQVGVKGFPRKTPLYFKPGESVRFHTPTGKIELYSTVLEKHGFHPLPRYARPEQPPQGFYRLNYGRTPAHTFGGTTNNPLLFQLQPENVLWVNPLVANEHGLNSGQYVRLKNQDGAVSNPIRVRVTERIRPDSVFMAHGFGHTAPGLRLTCGVGADDSALITRIAVDPIMGGTGMRGNFVTFVKESKEA